MFILPAVLVVVQVAPLLGHFLGPWCNALRNVRDDYEKEQAFRGLVAVVHKAPEPAVTSFAALASGYSGVGRGGAGCSWCVAWPSVCCEDSVMQHASAMATAAVLRSV